MGWQNLWQRKPAGASCAWVQNEQAAGAPYTYWRDSTVSCIPLPIQIELQFSGTYTDLRLAVQGSLISTKLGSSCVGGTTTYVPGGVGNTGGDRLYIRVNVWQALADGAWASSTVINIFGGKFSPAQAGTIYAGSTRIIGSFDNTNPTRQSKAVTIPVDTGCPVNQLATLTVYDDGHFILA